MGWRLPPVREQLADQRGHGDRIYEEADITFDTTNARIVGYLECDHLRGLMATINASDHTGPGFRIRVLRSPATAARHCGKGR